MSEREKIATWLNRQASERMAQANAIPNREVRLTCLGYATEYRLIAARIEAGEHLKKPEPTIPAAVWIDKPSAL